MCLLCKWTLRLWLYFGGFVFFVLPFWYFLVIDSWDHWCVWQVHFPFFEWSYEETCWCVWQPQGAPVAPPASVPGCGQGKCCQHIILACVQFWYNFTFPFCSCFQRTDHHHCLPLAPVSMCSYCLPNPLVLSVRFFVPSVVQYYLVHWLNIFIFPWWNSFCLIAY